MSPLFFLPITFGLSVLFLIIFIVRLLHSLVLVSINKSGNDLTVVCYILTIMITLFFANIMLIVTR
jgi:hypothetical protein